MIFTNLREVTRALLTTPQRFWITLRLFALWGPRRNPAQRFRWGEEPQRNERAFASGGSEGYAACGDEVQALLVTRRSGS